MLSPVHFLVPNKSFEAGARRAVLVFRDVADQHFRHVESSSWSRCSSLQTMEYLEQSVLHSEAFPCAMRTFVIHWLLPAVLGCPSKEGCWCLIHLYCVWYDFRYASPEATFHLEQHLFSPGYHLMGLILAWRTRVAAQWSWTSSTYLHSDRLVPLDSLAVGRRPPSPLALEAPDQAR